jgi:pimeloyl-ACP methyl ester carboxylesterase
MASLRGREPDVSYLRLRESFAAGDIDGARRALLHLSPEARQGLESRIGAQAMQRLLRVSRGVRAPSLGRVVVIHGIMGGELATIDNTGDEDLVWLRYLKLIAGDIERFALDQNAAPVDARFRVEPRGLLDDYLPLVFELSQRWQVLPVAFDWRLDIDLSAKRLDAEIRRWANGEPVHIVAHSMGGLVSRRFIRNFAATWAGMKDANGLQRGGRLVMLGTPNRGSFAIPFVLTGKEKTVRLLATFDLKHDMAQVLDIINTFPGSYQMLPSPLVPVNDDRLRLFESGTWGGFPVPQAYLDSGRRFQQEMHAVQDADRLIYVAGFDQATPYRIRVD